MRNVMMLLLVLVMWAVASPVFAQQSDELTGILSVGLGLGKGEDQDPGPYIISTKYWDPSWELGFEGYLDADTEDDNDALGMAWGIYRISLDEEGGFYIGAGGAGIFNNDPKFIDPGVVDTEGFSNSWGPAITAGYDMETFGVEFKYAWFDPGILSLVGYYHFR